MRSAKRSRLLWLALCAGVGPLASEAGAVVTINGWNTTSFPVDTNGNNVSNYEGTFDGAYTGTPVSPTTMLTVSHVFPASTSSFVYNNGGATATTYTVQIAATLDDLAAWDVQAGSFSLTAPVYTGSSEANSSIVELGRGYSRGGAVTGGWAWGGSQGTLSWGSNTVDGALPTDTQLNTGGGALGGDFLQYDFNLGSSNTNESMLSPFDSGGGDFIQVNGTYELAGVNSFYAVRIPSGGTDDAYNVTDSSGNAIGATLDNTNGYYRLLGFNAQNQPVVAQITTNTPESSFSTRISSKQNFVGLVDGTIPAAQAASHPINDDGLLTLFSNLTTGAITGGAQLALGGNGALTKLTLAPDSGVTQISSLSIPFGSTLDITNNKVILSYTAGHDPIAQIITWIKDGYSGGTWMGSEGITTSAPAVVNGFSYGVGYADGADGEVAGLPSGEIELMYTLLGDANLDGTVNSEDFTPLSQNLGKSGGWDKGDFNYDGTVNTEDFTSFSHNLGQSVVKSGVLETASGISLTNVPEPASVGLMVAAGLGILGRRRRGMKS